MLVPLTVIDKSWALLLSPTMLPYITNPSIKGAVKRENPSSFFDDQPRERYAMELSVEVKTSG